MQCVPGQSHGDELVRLVTVALPGDTLLRRLRLHIRVDLDRRFLTCHFSAIHLASGEYGHVSNHSYHSRAYCFGAVPDFAVTFSVFVFLVLISSTDSRVTLNRQLSPKSKWKTIESPIKSGTSPTRISSA